MAKELFLKGEIREHMGSRSASAVRRGGRTPAVIYGHKQEPIAISLDAHSLTEGLHRGHRLVDVQIGDKNEKVLIKDIQYDCFCKDVIHVDLMRVDISETVKVSVPIALKGTAKGAHEGGVIEGHISHLEVECRVTEIPESIVISVKEVGVGDVIYAGDVCLPDGVRLVSDPSTLLVTCGLVTVAKTTEELEAEAPTVPEVIGEVKEAEEGEVSEEEPEKRKGQKGGSQGED